MLAQDHLLKERRIHAAGAGKGEQCAARAQQLDGQQVDVLVGPRGVRHVLPRGGKPGRVEDDQVEGAAPVAVLAQHLKDIALDAGVGRASQALQGQVAAGQRQRVGRAVQALDRPRARRGRIDAERAAVGKGVEHLLPWGIASQRLAVRPLIQVKARLLPGFEVHQEAVAVLQDLDLGRRLGTPPELLSNPFLLSTSFTWASSYPRREATREAGR